MDRPKTYTDELEDTELFGNELGRLTGGHAEDGARRLPPLDRPARQRVEQLEEEEWLKRQLSDWDDLDFEDDDAFEPRL